MMSMKKGGELMTLDMLLIDEKCESSSLKWQPK
ncbi:BnaC05g26150D [Brassica napus]|uniref:BnaC05g26150D protein n=1 Tax=Brassica napus TaxID=3708 RepID=A0A078G795_BRANA|nr:BnaC05g26150D [Brassica napus]